MGVIMKKVIVLVGFFLAFKLSAGIYERTLILDYIPVPNMEQSFEIKTAKFDKVILDCQSFITGMNFYKNNKVAHFIYLDAYYDCPNMHAFISDSIEEKKPVCLDIEMESKSLTVSNESDCQ